MGSPKTWIALLAVAAVGAIAYLLSTGSETAIPAESSESSSAPAEEPEVPIAPSIADPDAPESNEGAADLSRAAVESAPSPATDAKTGKRLANCTVAGRVVDEAGRPLAEVPVRIDTIGDMVIVDENGQRQGPGERKTKTGRDGRFELKDVVPGFGFSVKAEAPGLVLASKPLARQDGGVLDVGDLVCEIGGTLVGRVVDDSGNGIAGAEVRAWTVEKPAAGGAGMILLGDAGGDSARSTKTDASGSFRIAGLKSGEIAIAASAEGFTRESKKGVALKKGESSAEIKIALSSGLAIEGIVVDRSGRALGGANVRIMETVVDLSEGGISSELQKSREVVADGNGNFRIGGLKSASYHVFGSADGHLPTTKESVPAGTRDLRVELDAAGMLVGYVRNATDESPVSDFEVIVRSEERMGFLFVPGRARSGVLYGEKAAAAAGLADAKGLFAVPSAPGRKLAVEIRASGYAASEEISVDVPPGATTRRDFELVPEIRLSGIVYTPQGDPLPGALVSASEKTAAGAPGGFQFRARRVTRDIDAGGAGDVHIDGEQAPERTDSEGRFTLKGLKPGDYEVAARHETWADSDPVGVTLKLGDDVEGIELTMKVAGVLTGIAHDADGNPLQGASIRLSPQGGDEGDLPMLAGISIPGGGPFGGKASWATSEADGSYRIEGIAPGEYLAELTKPRAEGAAGGFAFLAVAGAGGAGKGVPVKIEAGEETRQDLFLPATGRVRGTVTETNGPLEGVSVSLKKEDQGFLPMPAASAKTDSRGRFELEDVEPGEYTLAVKAAGAAAPLERKVNVRARETLDEDVRLPTGAMRGKVRDIASNKPLAGVTIEVKKHVDEDSAATAPQRPRRAMSMVMIADGGSGGAMQTMTFGDEEELVKTDADGNYEVRFLEPGEYDVEIRGGGVAPDKKERVTVREGAISEKVDFDATRGATLVITGKPADDDESLMFVVAEVTPTDDPTASRREAGGGSSIRVDGLKPGTYKVKLTSNQLAGETTVTVASGDVTPVEITLD